MDLLSKHIFTDTEHRGWLPWGALAPILALLMIAVPLITTGEFILAPLGLVDADQEPIGTYGLLALLFVSFGTVGAVFAAWIKGVERRPFTTVGLIAPGGWRQFWQGHGIGIGMMIAVVAAVTLAGGYSTGAIAPALASPTALFQIVLLLAGFALQSSVEEFVFRGWLLSVLTRKFNLLAAVIVSSLLFAFMHFNPANPWYDNINTLAFGLFACAWVIRTGTIWGVMGWHAGWNWFTAVAFDVPITGLESGTPALLVELVPTGPHWLNGAGTGPEGSIFCTVALVIGALYCLRRSKRVERTAYL